MMKQGGISEGEEGGGGGGGGRGVAGRREGRGVERRQRMEGERGGVVGRREGEGGQ